MSKNCFTICIDMDDTIEDLLPAWLEWLSNEYYLTCTVEDVDNWNILGLFPFLTKEQIYKPLFSSEFWKKVKPKEDAIVYIKKLIDEGHDVYICTASHYNSVAPKIIEIIEQYFPFIDYKHIIIAYNKQMIKCDVMIDDADHNLIGGDYYKLLFNASHNQGFNEAGTGIKRVYNWKEIYDLIHTLDWIYLCDKKETITY